jgi:hypothetical protein
MAAAMGHFFLFFYNLAHDQLLTGPREKKRGFKKLR